MATNKSQEAKDYIDNKLAAIFGSDYVGNIGGKVYIYGKTKDGEKIQVALSMTCPQKPVAPIDNPNNGFDWADTPTLAAPEPSQPAEAPEPEEENNLAVLLASLGL